jgi:plastocyanin
VLLLGIGAPSGDALSQASATAATGSIGGTVRFAGDPPPPQVQSNTKDTAKCGTEIRSEDLLVGQDKGIEYVVLRLEGAEGPLATPAKNPEMDQRGCRFTPRVVVVPAGGSLDFLNSDGILHNVRTTATRNPSINKAQPGFRKRMTERFQHPEIVKVSCDAHPWMTGWIVVTDHPYVAVTDERGAFRLAGVPPGSYTLSLWHETLGEQRQEVTVRAGEEKLIALEMGRS